MRRKLNIFCILFFLMNFVYAQDFQPLIKTAKNDWPRKAIILPYNFRQ